MTRVYFLYKFWVDVSAEDEAEARELAQDAPFRWDDSICLADWVDIDSIDINGIAEALDTHPPPEADGSAKEEP